MNHHSFRHVHQAIALRVQEQVDSLLLPVVKAYEARQTQRRLDTFITMTHRFSKIRSKRLQAAVSAVAGGPLSDELTLTAEERNAAATAAPAKAGSKGKGQGGKQAGAGKKRKQSGAAPAQAGAAGRGDADGDAALGDAGDTEAPPRGKRAKANGQLEQQERPRLPEADDDSYDSILDAEEVDKSLQGFLR